MLVSICLTFITNFLFSKPLSKTLPQYVIIFHLFLFWTLESIATYTPAGICQCNLVKYCVLFGVWALGLILQWLLGAYWTPTQFTSLRHWRVSGRGCEEIYSTLQSNCPGQGAYIIFNEVRSSSSNAGGKTISSSKGCLMTESTQSALSFQGFSIYPDYNWDSRVLNFK